MESVILSTPILLIGAIASIILLVISLFLKEIKIIPLLSLGIMIVISIVALFLQAEIIEVLIYSLIVFVMLLSTLIIRMKARL